MDRDTLTQLANKLQHGLAGREVLLNIVAQHRQQRKEHEKQLNLLYRLREYVQAAALSTQTNLQNHVSNLVSLALATIWDNPYGFEMQFDTQNNRTVCDLWLTRSQRRFKALGTVGGGVCNVVSFSLKLAYLTLKLIQHPTRLVLVLDEPFRDLHGDEQQLRCSTMMKRVCQLFNMQIIMISDVQNMNMSADNTIRFYNVNGETKVQQQIQRRRLT